MYKGMFSFQKMAVVNILPFVFVGGYIFDTHLGPGGENHGPFSGRCHGNSLKFQGSLCSTG